MIAPANSHPAGTDTGHPRATRRGWTFVGVAILFVGVATLLWPGQVTPGSAVAAVFPPGVPHAAAVEAAAQNGIHILGDNSLFNVVIVSADDTHALASLYRAGAWSLISIDGAWGCFGGTVPPAAPASGASS